MKREIKRTLAGIALILLAFGASVQLYAQARFQSLGSGQWSASGTWQLVSGSSGTGVPANGDTADIRSGHVVTSGSTTADCAILIVETGGTLSINGTANVRVNGNPGNATISGTVTMSSSGTLTKRGGGTRTFTITSGGKMTISGTAAYPSFDIYNYDPASTEEFTATGNQSILTGTGTQAIVYGNLTLGGGGTKTAAPINVDTTFRVAGTLNVAANTTFDVSTNVLRIYFAGDVINYGTIDASVGVTVLTMTGSSWMNYGTYLPSTTSGYGYTPSTIFVNTTIGGSASALTFYDLVVNGTMTVQGGLTVGRNVTISSGATLNAGSGLTHTVGGNWTNNGTFNCGTSTVSFTGTFGRTISASTFYNAILSDSLGATLTGNVTIASGGSFVVNAGNISTAAYALTINATDPAAFTPGAWTVTGTLVRAIAPGSTGTYRFFDANSYIIPGGTGNPLSVSATAYPGANPPALPHASDTSKVLKRYYTITGSGMGAGFTYTMRLSYARAEVRGNALAYTLWENSGNGWTNMGVAGLPDTTAHWAQQSGLTGFSDWTLAENSAPLPIQLVSFAAATVSGSGAVRLSWATASEVNNFGFYIQRSVSATNGFADLPGAFIAGSGTSIGTRQYEWVDGSPIPGTSYYRLKQVDLDGSAHYSDAVQVTSVATSASGDPRAAATFALGQNYPNPFNPATRITFTVEKPGFTTLKVYSILGDEVATLFEGMAQPGTSYNVAFDGSSLANGAYFYRLISGDRTSLKKMLLVK